jgi:hypothetical protein
MKLSNLVTACLLAAVAAVAAPHDSRPAAAALRAPGPYVIQNENSGLCLTARAGSGERPVVQTTCSGLPDQSWEMNLVSSDVWQIRSPFLGLCLAARGSGEVAVLATTCNAGWRDQTWLWHSRVVAPYPPQYSLFENRNSGLCIAARGFAESRALVTTCGGWADQRWDVI